MAAPTLYIDQCPKCRTPFDDAALPSLTSRLPLGHCTAAVCTACNHVIAVGVSEDGKRVESSAAPYDWFHEWFPEEDRLKIHEHLERVFCERGQWG